MGALGIKQPEELHNEAVNEIREDDATLYKDQLKGRLLLIRETKLQLKEAERALEIFKKMDMPQFLESRFNKSRTHPQPQSDYYIGSTR